MKSLILKTLIPLIAIINLSITMEQAEANPSVCEWLGNTATVISQNHENEISEFDLIENHLDQRQSYDEQIIIIPLIMRLNEMEIGISPSTIAIVEQQQCELA